MKPGRTPEAAGRCSACDFAFDESSPGERAQHRRFHRRFLAAVAAVGAPVAERVRRELLNSGLSAQRAEDFEARVQGAEQWLLSRYHSYLFSILLHGGSRMDLREYFTRVLESTGQLASTFGPQVVRVMSRRYSDRPQLE